MGSCGFICSLLIQECLVQVSLDKLTLETWLGYRGTNVVQFTVAVAGPIPCAAADSRMIFPSRPILLACAHRNCRRIFNKKMSQQQPLGIRCKCVPRTRHDSEYLCCQITPQIVLFGRSVTLTLPGF